jgi:soluble lytic murein transglycosylase-like protein
MQLRPETAQWISAKYNLDWKGAQQLKVPEYNLKMSALYFNYLKGKFNSKSSKYINAYNMGAGRLIRAPSSEVNEHPFYHKVIKNYLDIYSELKKIKRKKIASK